MEASSVNAVSKWATTPTARHHLLVGLRSEREPHKGDGEEGEGECVTINHPVNHKNDFGSPPYIHVNARWMVTIRGAGGRAYCGSCIFNPVYPCNRTQRYLFIRKRSKNWSQWAQLSSKETKKVQDDGNYSRCSCYMRVYIFYPKNNHVKIIIPLLNNASYTVYLINLRHK